VAQSEGVVPNQFINVALAEKLAALRTAGYFAERFSRANVSKALKLLSKAGKGRPPI